MRVREKLPSERDLAEQLGVGQRSVREALRSLQAMGFIEIKHGKGAFVSQIRLDNYFESLAESISFRLHEEKTALLQLLEIRKLLEAGIASLSASRRTPQDLKAMEKTLHQQKKAIKAKQSLLNHSGQSGDCFVVPKVFGIPRNDNIECISQILNGVY